MRDIEILGVSKCYGNKIVLDRFSLKLNAGQTTVLMGPSGCGKTTLLRLIAGLERADEGEIRGVDRDNLSMVFQEDRLLTHLTALKNVTMVMNGAEMKTRAAEILTRMGLAESMNQKVSTLSGGMARRVAIARALVFDADTMIMDEPFKGLDEETRLGVMEEVRKSARGKTLLVVTHDPEEAQALGGNLIRMTANVAFEKNLSR